MNILEKIKSIINRPTKRDKLIELEGKYFYAKPFKSLARIDSYVDNNYWRYIMVDDSGNDTDSSSRLATQPLDSVLWEVLDYWNKIPIWERHKYQTILD